MTMRKDLAGHRFGRLVAIEDIGSNSKRHRIWKCQCDCGEFVNVCTGSLGSGNSNSCGCLQRELLSARLRKHGMTGSLIHGVWLGMRDRCKNPKNSNYGRYGGRGIQVCKAWDDAQVFINWAILNGYEIGLEIDRRDNDGNYEPENCRWVTTQINMNNRAVTLKYKGIPLSDYIRGSGVSYHTAVKRFHRGADPLKHARQCHTPESTEGQP